MIKGTEIAAARSLLSWRQMDLAAKAAIAAPSLCNYEGGLRIPKERMARIKSVLKAEGVEFINTPQGRGVILKNGHGIGD